MVSACSYRQMTPTEGNNSAKVAVNKSIEMIFFENQSDVSRSNSNFNDYSTPNAFFEFRRDKALRALQQQQSDPNIPIESLNDEEEKRNEQYFQASQSLTQRISSSINGVHSQKSILTELRASETPPIPSSTDCVTSGGLLSEEEERKAYLEIYSKVCPPAAAITENKSALSS